MRWPGKRFGAPFFIHYGRNGGQVAQDGADRFVYALSNNGFWNGGDDYILARVPRDRIAALNAADWAGQPGRSLGHCGGAEVPRAARQGAVTRI